jgi:addiction module HigA family antidote
MDVRLESLFPSPVLHPGAVLQVEFLDRYAIPQGELAKAIGIEPTNLCAVIHHRRSVSFDVGRRLASALATLPEFWLLRQLAWDLEHARPLPRIDPLPQLTDPSLRDARLRSGLYLSKPDLLAERWPQRESAG